MGTIAEKKSFADIGIEAMPGSPEHFFNPAGAEAQRWSPVITKINVQLN